MQGDLDKLVAFVKNEFPMDARIFLETSNCITPSECLYSQTIISIFLVQTTSDFIRRRVELVLSKYACTAVN
jgi:hypothetical protein